MILKVHLLSEQINKQMPKKKQTSTNNNHPRPTGKEQETQTERDALETAEVIGEYDKARFNFIFQKLTKMRKFIGRQQQPKKANRTQTIKSYGNARTSMAASSGNCQRKTLNFERN